ncbi:MAG: ArsR family transcriptional regulator, arsenate/arsenite/antimonite-responsive transcriptional [Actinomycetota bacterium]|jgi:ArsR family transcriptional regulator|nr:ArsR family transcriptional regulator, arsenate/arsenite/antimonite-responsive transcriptional [Actinomycetota bacterium]
MQALLQADGRKELAQLDGVACCAPLAGAEISPQDAGATANLFKALADPTRVRLVNMLANSAEPVCVCELNAHFDLGQPTISHHLKKLVLAGLLKREQRGTWAYFSLDNESLQRLTDMTKPRGGKVE